MASKKSLLINRSVKKCRKDGAGRRWASIIKTNARISDAKAGRDFSLSLPFVQSKLMDPCSYCGRKVPFMGLDRVNNFIGHIESNTVTCCRLCNHIRGSMPIEAWMIVSPYLNEVIASGLLIDWENQFNRRLIA